MPRSKKKLMDLKDILLEINFLAAKMSSHPLGKYIRTKSYTEEGFQRITREFSLKKLANVPIPLKPGKTSVYHAQKEFKPLSFGEKSIVESYERASDELKKKILTSLNKQFTTMKSHYKAMENYDWNSIPAKRKKVEGKGENERMALSERKLEKLRKAENEKRTKENKQPLPPLSQVKPRGIRAKKDEEKKEEKKDDDIDDDGDEKEEQKAETMEEIEENKEKRKRKKTQEEKEEEEKKQGPPARKRKTEKKKTSSKKKSSKKKKDDKEEKKEEEKKDDTKISNADDVILKAVNRYMEEQEKKKEEEEKKQSELNKEKIINQAVDKVIEEIKKSKDDEKKEEKKEEDKSLLSETNMKKIVDEIVNIYVQDENSSAINKIVESVSKIKEIYKNTDKSAEEKKEEAKEKESKLPKLLLSSAENIEKYILEEQEKEKEKEKRTKIADDAILNALNEISKQREEKTKKTKTKRKKNEEEKKDDQAPPLKKQKVGESQSEKKKKKTSSKKKKEEKKEDNINNDKEEADPDPIVKVDENGNPIPITEEKKDDNIYDEDVKTAKEETNHPRKDIHTIENEKRQLLNEKTKDFKRELETRLMDFLLFDPQYALQLPPGEKPTQQQLKDRRDTARETINAITSNIPIKYIIANEDNKDKHFNILNRASLFLDDDISKMIEESKNDESNKNTNDINDFGDDSNIKNKIFYIVRHALKKQKIDELNQIFVPFFDERNVSKTMEKLDSIPSYNDVTTVKVLDLIQEYISKHGGVSNEGRANLKDLIALANDTAAGYYSEEGRSVLRSTFDKENREYLYKAYDIIESNIRSEQKNVDDELQNLNIYIQSHILENTKKDKIHLENLLRSAIYENINNGGDNAKYLANIDILINNLEKGNVSVQQAIGLASAINEDTTNYYNNDTETSHFVDAYQEIQDYYKDIENDKITNKDIVKMDEYKKKYDLKNNYIFQNINMSRKLYQTEIEKYNIMVKNYNNIGQALLNNKGIFYNYIKDFDSFTPLPQLNNTDIVDEKEFKELMGSFLNTETKLSSVMENISKLRIDSKQLKTTFDICDLYSNQTLQGKIVNEEALLTTSENNPGLADMHIKYGTYLRSLSEYMENIKIRALNHMRNAQNSVMNYNSALMMKQGLALKTVEEIVGNDNTSELYADEIASSSREKYYDSRLKEDGIEEFNEELSQKKIPQKRINEIKNKVINVYSRNDLYDGINKAELDIDNLQKSLKKMMEKEKFERRRDDYLNTEIYEFLDSEPEVQVKEFTDILRKVIHLETPLFTVENDLDEYFRSKEYTKIGLEESGIETIMNKIQEKEQKEEDKKFEEQAGKIMSNIDDINTIPTKDIDLDDIFKKPDEDDKDNKDDDDDNDDEDKKLQSIVPFNVQLSEKELQQGLQDIQDSINDFIFQGNQGIENINYNTEQAANENSVAYQMMLQESIQKQQQQQQQQEEIKNQTAEEQKEEEKKDMEITKENPTVTDLINNMNVSNRIDKIVENPLVNTNIEIQNNTQFNTGIPDNVDITQPQTIIPPELPIDNDSKMEDQTQPPPLPPPPITNIQPKPTENKDDNENKNNDQQQQQQQEQPPLPPHETNISNPTDQVPITEEKQEEKKEEAPPVPPVPPVVPPTQPYMPAAPIVLPVPLTGNQIIIDVNQSLNEKGETKTQYIVKNNDATTTTTQEEKKEEDQILPPAPPLPPLITDTIKMTGEKRKDPDDFEKEEPNKDTKRRRIINERSEEIMRENSKKTNQLVRKTQLLEEKIDEQESKIMNEEDIVEGFGPATFDKTMEQLSTSFYGGNKELYPNLQKILDRKDVRKMVEDHTLTSEKLMEKMMENPKSVSEYRTFIIDMMTNIQNTYQENKISIEKQYQEQYDRRKKLVAKIQEYVDLLDKQKISDQAYNGYLEQVNEYLDYVDSSFQHYSTMSNEASIVNQRMYDGLQVLRTKFSPDIYEIYERNVQILKEYTDKIIGQKAYTFDFSTSVHQFKKATIDFIKDINDASKEKAINNNNNDSGEFKNLTDEELIAILEEPLKSSSDDDISQIYQKVGNFDENETQTFTNSLFNNKVKYDKELDAQKLKNIVEDDIKLSDHQEKFIGKKLKELKEKYHYGDDARTKEIYHGPLFPDLKDYINFPLKDMQTVLNRYKQLITDMSGGKRILPRHQEFALKYMAYYGLYTNRKRAAENKDNTESIQQSFDKTIQTLTDAMIAKKPVRKRKKVNLDEPDPKKFKKDDKDDDDKKDDQPPPPPPAPPAGSASTSSATKPPTEQQQQRASRAKERAKQKEERDKRSRDRARKKEPKAEINFAEAAQFIQRELFNAAIQSNYIDAQNSQMNKNQQQFNNIILGNDVDLKIDDDTGVIDDNGDDLDLTDITTSVNNSSIPSYDEPPKDPIFQPPPLPPQKKPRVGDYEQTNAKLSSFKNINIPAPIIDDKAAPVVASVPPSGDPAVPKTKLKGLPKKKDADGDIKINIDGDKDKPVIDPSVVPKNNLKKLSKKRDGDGDVKMDNNDVIIPPPPPPPLPDKKDVKMKDVKEPKEPKEPKEKDIKLDKPEDMEIVGDNEEDVEMNDILIKPDNPLLAESPYVKSVGNKPILGKLYGDAADDGIPRRFKTAPRSYKIPKGRKSAKGKRKKNKNYKSINRPFLSKMKYGKLGKKLPNRLQIKGIEGKGIIQDVDPQTNIVIPKHEIAINNPQKKPKKPKQLGLYSDMHHEMDEVHNRVNYMGYIWEYRLNNQEDAEKMIQDIQYVNQEGTIYKINEDHGRLFPIDPKSLEYPGSYIFVRKGYEDFVGSHALGVVKQNIEQSTHDMFPIDSIKYDKSLNMTHLTQLPEMTIPKKKPGILNNHFINILNEAEKQILNSDNKVPSLDNHVDKRKMKSMFSSMNTISYRGSNSSIPKFVKFNNNSNDDNEKPKKAIDSLLYNISKGLIMNSQPEIARILKGVVVEDKKSDLDYVKRLRDSIKVA